MNPQRVTGQLLADRAVLAAFFNVSERTVRRHCRPVDHNPSAGLPRGVAGRALYDADAAATALADVIPRPDRTRALADLRKKAEPQ